MKNTLKILSRLSEADMKRRLILILLVIQSLVLSLIVLMYINTILSNARINGELDYYQIKFFYNLTSRLMFVLVSVYVPFFVSNTLNVLYEKSIVEHMLAVKISIKDIVLAIYLRGLISIMTLIIAAFPIISISFYFGGLRVYKIFRLLALIITYSIFLSSICIYISSIIKDKNVSIIIAYVLSIIFAVLNIININNLLNSAMISLMYIVFSVVLSMIFLSLARNTHIFNT